MCHLADGVPGEHGDVGKAPLPMSLVPKHIRAKGGIDSAGRRRRQSRARDRHGWKAPWRSNYGLNKRMGWVSGHAGGSERGPMPLLQAVVEENC